jgi:UDP-3-O-[3-hydroxymyristoyl] glucosamine N-acyltransferase
MKRRTFLCGSARNGNATIMCSTVQKASGRRHYLYHMAESRCMRKERTSKAVRRGIRKTLLAGLFSAFILTASSVAAMIPQEVSNVATLAAGATIGSVNSTAAFTAGANSNINGFVTAAAAVTLGAFCTITGNVTAGAAFTSGDSCTIKGSVSAQAAFTGGANSIVGGNVRVGADFTSGANSIVVGDVYVTGAVTLGARSRILGSVHSGTGVITYGKGATVGSTK